MLFYFAAEWIFVLLLFFYLTSQERFKIICVLLNFCKCLSRLELGFLNPTVGIPLADQKEDSYRLLWMLGLALTLPMILLSGPVAGYLISWLLIHYLGMPSGITPLLMGAGLVGSAIQAFHLIQKLKQQSNSKKP